MLQFVKEQPTHDTVLFRVVEVVTDYERKNYPSPSISQISIKIGYPEETILESMEFGNLEPITLYQ